MAKGKGKAADPTDPVPGTEITLAPPEPRLVQVEVPLLDDQPGYVQRHLDVQLSNDQATVLRALFAGLDQRGDRLANGGRVKNMPDALRWLLERMSSGQPS